jgi:uncharacterized protein (TIGR00255 family)
MILSMTGFGDGSSQKGSIRVAVEVRTVNHRFLDLHVRLAREYAFLEAEIQPLVRSMLRRGRAEVSVMIQSARPADRLLDPDIARGYVEAAGKLRDEFHLSDSLDLKTLMLLPGVVRGREDSWAPDLHDGALSETLAQSLRAALEGVLAMRRREGEALKTEMSKHLAGIGEKISAVRALVAANVNDCHKRLEERLSFFLADRQMDPQRLAQEVALLVERSDISEEVSRMQSHLEQFTTLLEEASDVGKKLDFLLQEMQREVNTILSKAANFEITSLGIAMKADIEKLREQVQNVE